MRVTVESPSGAQAFEARPGEPILRAALRQRIALPYDCATGTCGRCKARLVAGRAVDGWPEAPGRRSCRGPELLTCQSTAGGDCVLAVDRAPPGQGSLPWPRGLTGTLRGRRGLTHDVLAVEVELEAPLAFAAGQFVLLECPEVVGARAYSIAGATPDGRRITLLAKRRPGGRFGAWLSEGATDGAPLAVFGPLGRAVFDPGVGRRLLCIAGGTGLAGMLAIVDRAASHGHLAHFDVRLFFGVRAPRDVFYLDELSALRRRHPDRLSITVALSDEAPPPPLRAAWPELDFDHGPIHEVAGRRLQGPCAVTRAYLAGPRAMVDASARLLLQQARLPPHEIHRDRFD